MKLDHNAIEKAVAILTINTSAIECLLIAKGIVTKKEVKLAKDDFVKSMVAEFVSDLFENDEPETKEQVEAQLRRKHNIPDEAQVIILGMDEGSIN